MTDGSAIYVGTVAHSRLRPRAHAFRYRAYWMLFDLDDLAGLHASLRWFSYNRRNLFSFYDTDHCDGSGAPLRKQIETHLNRAGIDLEGGRIRILCMPRVLGFVFNPLSVHFCYGPVGDLRAIMYEVHNTFRQRHSYLIARPQSDEKERVDQSCAKRFYVSPFMPMDMRYRFRVSPPADTVGVIIHGDDAEGPLIVASLAGRRRPLSDGMLLRLFSHLPAMTVKVVAAIHWEALRLWLKGLQLQPRPAPPEHLVTAKGAERVPAE